MSKFNDLELKLNDVFVHKAPKLPENGKKLVVEWSPWISLVAGILTLLSAIGLWHWAHVVNNLSNYANALCTAYGGDSCTAAAPRLSVWVWLTLIVIFLEGLLYLLAFPGLRDRKKHGWNLLYYGALLNVAYALVNLLTGYNVLGNFIGALIGSAIGFYFLFQIRSYYISAAAASSPKVTPAAEEPKAATTPADSKAPAVTTESSETTETDDKPQV